MLRISGILEIYLVREGFSYSMSFSEKRRLAVIGLPPMPVK